MSYTEIDDRIMRYIPKSKHKAIRACWQDSDGYWITLKEGYNADRTDNNCRTIHEDTISQLRYQIAGISVDNNYWEENYMEEKNATNSIVYSDADSNMMLEIIKQDRFTAIMHVVYGNEREYELAIQPTFDDAAGTVKMRVGSMFNTLAEAESAQNVYELSQRKGYFTNICRDIKQFINDSNYETYRYDFDSACEKCFERYTPEDAATALALYIKQHDWDGRISAQNKAWAKEQLEGTLNDRLERFGVEMAHPAVMDGFIDDFRKCVKEAVNSANKSLSDRYVYTAWGDKEALKQFKDYALSLGCSTHDNNNTILVYTHKDHLEDLNYAKYELGLTGAFKEESSYDRLVRLINDWCEAEHDQPANFSNKEHIDIAYTTDPDSELEIQVYVDIEQLRIVKEYDGVVVSETYYESEKDMGDVFLDLEFDEVVALTDKEKAIAENGIVLPNVDNGRK